MLDSGNQETVSQSLTMINHRLAGGWFYTLFFSPALVVTNGRLVDEHIFRVETANQLATRTRFRLRCTPGPTVVNGQPREVGESNSWVSPNQQRNNHSI